MSADILIDADILIGADILIDADILIGADILIDADILIGANILGRQHFDVNYYFVYCRRTPTFLTVYDFAVSSASLFCNKFCLIFYC